MEGGEERGGKGWRGWDMTSGGSVYLKGAK